MDGVSEKRHGAHPGWGDLFADQTVLDQYVGGWQVGEAVPGDMAAVLHVARRLLLRSYTDYELVLVAVTWSLLGLEAALRVCLGVDDGPDLGHLIKQAKERQLVAVDEAEALDGARKLRNMIAHGALLPEFEPVAAVEMVGAIHDAVSDLYGRAQRRG